MARRYGAKRIFKSKCTEHLRFGAIFEVTSKNCTPLRREAHFQVKMYKTNQPQSNFFSSEVPKMARAVARSAFASQNVKQLTGSGHFLNFRCPKMARRCGAKNICKSKH